MAQQIKVNPESRSLLALLILLGVAIVVLIAYTAMACDNIPDEPAAEEAITEGPKGFSSLYEHDYDLGGGRRLITLRRIVDMTMDAGLEATYTVQAYPLLYVVIVPGVSDKMYVDRGHGLNGVPQGFCFDIVRYQ